MYLRFVAALDSNEHDFRHTHTCFKNQKTVKGEPHKSCVCRFCFPRAPSDATYSKRLVEFTQKLLGSRTSSSVTSDDSKSLVEFTEKLLGSRTRSSVTSDDSSASADSESTPHPQFDSDSTVDMVMKRCLGHEYINTFVPAITLALRCNNDIRVLMFESAIQFYVCKYEKCQIFAKFHHYILTVSRDFGTGTQLNFSNSKSTRWQKPSQRLAEFKHVWRRKE